MRFRISNCLFASETLFIHHQMICLCIVRWCVGLPTGEVFIYQQTVCLCRCILTSLVYLPSDGVYRILYEEVDETHVEVLYLHTVQEGSEPEAIRWATEDSSLRLIAPASKVLSLCLHAVSN